ncbi:MAG TPA: lytic transglycosylase domain-containing protein, partial [Actinomycetales bacterium]|nr:lytic transglycosylase domain-containing protein [Actinomycetales bacterium]
MDGGPDDVRVVALRVPRLLMGRGRLQVLAAGTALAAALAGMPAPAGETGAPGTPSGPLAVADDRAPAGLEGVQWAETIAEAGTDSWVRFSLVAATMAVTPPGDGDPAGGRAVVTGMPPITLQSYVDAAARLATEDPSCRLGWSLLAGIGHVESRHGTFRDSFPGIDGTVVPPIIGIPLDGQGVARIGDSDGGRWDGDTVFDRAVGPMQFIPGTWRAFGADGDGNGHADPQNVHDASLAAARYLCAGSGDLSQGSDLRRAVLRYNRSASYADHVLRLAYAYATGEVALRTADGSSETTAETPIARAPVDPGAQVRTVAVMTAAGALPPTGTTVTTSPGTGTSSSSTTTGPTTTGPPTTVPTTTVPTTTVPDTTMPDTTVPTTTVPDTTGLPATPTCT